MSSFEETVDFSGPWYPQPLSRIEHLINEACSADATTIISIEPKEAYDNFVPPTYNDDGAFVLSSIPRGKIGHFVFLKEAPAHIYFIHRRRYDGPIPDAELANEVREFRKDTP